MKIGEVAERSGLAPSRIRFYEARGLIERARRGRNGYREFPVEVLQRLDIITHAQGAGFALEEIRALLPSPGGKGWRDAALLATLRKKVDAIDLLMGRLAVNKVQLLAIIDGIEHRPADLPCAANTERILEKVRSAPKGTSSKRAFAAS